jgi:hypothetical protein
MKKRCPSTISTPYVGSCPPAAGYHDERVSSAEGGVIRSSTHVPPPSPSPTGVTHVVMTRQAQLTLLAARCLKRAAILYPSSLLLLSLVHPDAGSGELRWRVVARLLHPRSTTSAVSARTPAGRHRAQERRPTCSLVQLRFRVALGGRFGEGGGALLATVRSGTPGAFSEADGSRVARYPRRSSRNRSVGSGAHGPLRLHQGSCGPTPCPTCWRPILLCLLPSCARCRDRPRCPRSRLARTTSSWFLTWSVPSSP